MRTKLFIPAIAIPMFLGGAIGFAGENGTSSSSTSSRSTTSTSSTLAVRTFTIDEAVQTALQQNPDILRARQEIRRTKGVFIEVLAQVVPHITGTGQFQRTDPALGRGSFDGLGGGSGGGTGTDNTYFLRLQTTQLAFSGTAIPSIRGADFQKDSAYFALRNTIDQVITTVRQQFYLV